MVVVTLVAPIGFQEHPSIKSDEKLVSALPDRAVTASATVAAVAAIVGGYRGPLR